MKLLLPAFIVNYIFMVIRSVIITKNDKSGSNNLRAQKMDAYKYVHFINEVSL
ncbi:MAG: hypothetical protein OQK52_06360 [Ignavibacteriaceae bacterium]|nr:hypothetical protein [Ignavibacteriaceae bacterium]